jgi:hypothetical protein
MYPSKRPPLVLSRLSPALVAFPVTGRHVLVCPTCGTWQSLRHATGGTVITPHRRRPRDEHERRDFDLIETTGDRLPRCPDAARLVHIDLNPAQWRARLANVPRDASTRRAARVHPRPTAPVARPVFRLAS